MEQNIGATTLQEVSDNCENTSTLTEFELQRMLKNYQEHISKLCTPDKKNKIENKKKRGKESNDTDSKELKNMNKVDVEKYACAVECLFETIHTMDAMDMDMKTAIRSINIYDLLHVFINTALNMANDETKSEENIYIQYCILYLLMVFETFGKEHPLLTKNGHLCVHLLNSDLISLYDLISSRTVSQDCYDYLFTSYINILMNSLCEICQGNHNCKEKEVHIIKKSITDKILYGIGLFVTNDVHPNTFLDVVEGISKQIITIKSIGKVFSRYGGIQLFQAVQEHISKFSDMEEQEYNKTPFDSNICNDKKEIYSVQSTIDTLLSWKKMRDGRTKKTKQGNKNIENFENKQVEGGNMEEEEKVTINDEIELLHIETGLHVY